MQIDNQFVLYNASAGSGKTYTLVKTVLGILLQNPNPNVFEQILAITFTNKASNEMKNRLLDWLSNFSNPENYATNQELEMLANELNLPKEELHQRAKTILSQILHNYSKLSFSTIDKFNLRIMKSFAKDLGLSLNFDVELDSKKILNQAIDHLLSELQPNDLLTNILIDISLQRLENDKTWHLEQEFSTIIGNLFYEQHQPYLAQLKKLAIEDFDFFRKQVQQQYWQLKNDILNHAKMAMDSIQKKHLQADDFASGQRGLYGYFTKILKGNFDFPTTTHKTIIEERKIESGKASLEAKLAIEEIFNALAEKFQQIVQNLPAYFLLQKINQTLPVIGLVNQINQQIHAIKEQDNVLLIHEFNQLINQHLQSQPSAFIYERIGNRYHYFLIDEFQDTSNLQWNNLLPLIENAQATNDFVLLVGDVKQAIYRWRGGNPKLMLDLIDSNSAHVKKLETNWRSSQNIVLFNNQLYQIAAKFLPQPQHKHLYLGSKQNQNNNLGGFVSLDLLDSKNIKQDNLDLIVQQIHNAVEQNFGFGDIAILHRSKKEGQLIADYLMQQQIPVLSSESLLLSHAKEVQLIVDLLLLKKNDYLAKDMASFLLNLQQVHAIGEEEMSSFLLQIKQSKPQDLFDFLLRFDLDLQWLQEPMISLYDFVESANRSLYLSNSAPAHIVGFLDLVLEFVNKKNNDLDLFLEFWEQEQDKASLSVSNANAVQLLTIHKSKGLEFPVVIVAFSNWQSKSNGMWIPIEHKELDFLYVNSVKNIESSSEPIEQLVQEEKELSNLDDLNLLYVATTRAKERLHIIGQKINPKSKTEPSLISSILQEFVNTFGENYAYQSGNKKREQLPKPNLNLVKEFTAKSVDWKNRIAISQDFASLEQIQKMQMGDLVHAILAKIKYKKDTEPTLKAFGLNQFIGQEEVEQVKQKINLVVEHPKLSHFFNGEYEVYNERDFVNKNGILFRPDRVQFKQKECVILDYKTGKERAQDIQQIHMYAQYFLELGYTVKSFLVYIKEKGINLVEA